MQLKWKTTNMTTTTITTRKHFQCLWGDPNWWFKLWCCCCCIITFHKQRETVCVCVCVCAHEREKERERARISLWYRRVCACICITDGFVSMYACISVCYKCVCVLPVVCVIYAWAFPFLCHSLCMGACISACLCMGACISACYRYITCECFSLFV